MGTATVYRIGEFDNAPRPSDSRPAVLSRRLDKLRPKGAQARTGAVYASPSLQGSAEWILNYMWAVLAKDKFYSHGKYNPSFCPALYKMTVPDTVNVHYIPYYNGSDSDYFSAPLDSYWSTALPLREWLKIRETGENPFEKGDLYNRDYAEVLLRPEEILKVDTFRLNEAFESVSEEAPTYESWQQFMERWPVLRMF